MTITDVRHVSSRAAPETEWRTLRCRAGDGAPAGTLVDPVTSPGAASSARTVSFRGHGYAATFTHRFTSDTNVVGPMVATLTLSLEGDDNLSIFVGVRKFRDGKEVTFEGSYGFQDVMVTYGMILVSHRGIAPEQSTPNRPHHPHTQRQPVAPGETVEVNVELLPSATLFRAGDELRLEVQGHWSCDRDPASGQFPAGDAAVDRATCRLHLGVDGCTLLLGVLSPTASTAHF